MSLASTQLAPPPALRVAAIAGRFPAAPARPLDGGLVHLLHGEQDGMMPVDLSRQAQTQLQALGTATTLDTFAGLGHGLDQRVLQRLVQRLAEPLPGER